MIRILFILAIAYGIFWFGSNYDFSQMKTIIIQTFKKEKTINHLNNIRLETQDDYKDFVISE